MNMNFEFSADYLYLDIALKSFWCPFNELVAEIESFIPRPLSDYEDERKQWVDQLKELNPESSDESLKKTADGIITTAARDDLQFSSRFSEPFMTQYVTVAFLSHALCEAVINQILAVGLTQNGSHELFSILEKTDVKEK